MFDITFETISPESAENGEAESMGCYMDNMRFTEAVSCLRNLGAWGCHCEADTCPIDPVNPPRWLTFTDVSTDYTTGEVTSYALHIPDNITPASRIRIARAAGCYGIKE